MTSDNIIQQYKLVPIPKYGGPRERKLAANTTMREGFFLFFYYFYLFILRKKADKPTPSFCQVERRFHGRESNRQSLP